MKKVLVAEIDKTTLRLTVFGDMDSKTPLLLGKVINPLSLDEGVRILEQDIGNFTDDHLEIYIVNLAKGGASNSKGQSLSLVSKAPMKDVQNTSLWSKAKMVDKDQAIINLSSLMLEEVGDMLILDSNEESIDLYMLQKNLEMAQGKSVEVYHNPQHSIRTIAETAEEIALERLLVVKNLQQGFDQLLGSAPKGALHKKRDLTHLRWVIGTGRMLSDLPGGMEIIQEIFVQGNEKAYFPKEGFPILIDRDNILIPLGAISDTYREGVWTMLLESLGVES